MTGEDVKALRNALGLTQREFAKFALVSAATISRWERRRTLSRLAEQQMATIALDMIEYQEK